MTDERMRPSDDRVQPSPPAVVDPNLHIGETRRRCGSARRRWFWSIATVFGVLTLVICVLVFARTSKPARQPIATLQHEDSVVSLAFSPDGTTLGAGSKG